MAPHTAQMMRHSGAEPARASAIDGDTKIPEPANTPTSCKIQYSRTPLIQIIWDGEPSGYAGNPDNWIFLRKQAKLAV